MVKRLNPIAIWISAYNRVCLFEPHYLRKVRLICTIERTDFDEKDLVVVIG